MTWQEKFDEKFKEYFKNFSVGQYNNKGINIGFLEASEVVKRFIFTLLEEQRRKILEDLKENLPIGQSFLPNIKSLINK